MQSARQTHEKQVREKIKQQELDNNNNTPDAKNVTIKSSARAEKIEQANKQKEYSMEFVEFKNQHIHVDDLPDRAVSPADLKNMPMTTYAREKLPPKMTDETLILIAEKYSAQVTLMHQPAATYEEMLIHSIMPEFIQRLKDHGSSN